MKSSGVTNTCCTPYDQGSGGNIIGSCPASTNECSLVQSQQSV